MSKQGKKKAVIKMSLGEFHSATPMPQESAAAPASSLNWADEMEKLDDNVKPVDFAFDRSQLPTATKAALEPDFDLAQVPSKPPFTAHLSNISFEADDAKVRGFFNGCNILNLRLPIDERGTFKGHGYIDFTDRESLISALKKNATPFFNRPLRVQLESDHKKKQLQQRGDYTELRSDEADWRRPQQTEESQPTRSYGEQRGGRGGYGQQRRGGNHGHQGHQGYQQRDNHQGYHQRDNQQGYHQRENQQGYHQRDNQQGYQQRDNQQGYQRKPYGSGYRQQRASETSEHAESHSVSSSASTPTTSMTERPKLNLAPRTLPVEESKIDSGEKSSSIFGSAKPVNTAAREREIEEKLKKDRLEAERLEKERREKEKEEQAAHQDEPQTESREEPANQEEEEEFQVVGKPRQHNKNDNNNNTIRNQNRPSNYTSPQQRYKKSESSSHQAEAPRENVWKTKTSAAELFSKEPSQAEATDSQRARPQGDDTRRSLPPKRTEYQNRDRQNRNGNRDNKDRRFSDRNKPMNKNPRGERQFERPTDAKPVRPRNETAEQPSANKTELGFVNKFSNLAIDVEDADDYVEEE